MRKMRLYNVIGIYDFAIICLNWNSDHTNGIWNVMKFVFNRKREEKIQEGV